MRRLSVLLAAALAFASTLFAADVVIVAKEPGYYTSLAKHAARWLKSEMIDSSIETPATMPKALQKAKIAFLVGFDRTTKAEISELKSFRRRGGRFVVFYSSSSELAALMDVKLLGYAKAAYPGQWSRMDFNVRFPEGCPASILQTSTVLQRAAPVRGKSRVMATWSDRRGKSAGEAAWISGAAGYWMTHVLLADGDEALKARLLAAMVGSVAPRLWNASVADARKAAKDKALYAYAAAQRPRAGEIRAVWEHSGCGLYPGDWRRTIRVLKASGVTDLFVNVAGAGFAHYPSRVLPRSKTFFEEGDQLKACLEAANGSGIRVHAWILCFTATRASPATVADFRRRGWLLKTRTGGETDYIDPSDKEARRHVLSAISEIVSRYKVDGVHLDFVRWYERSAKPRGAAGAVSSFVAEARLRVRRPAWLTTAVLGKYPACVDSTGQDWVAWIDSNIVDYVVPMDYTEDISVFSQYLAQHSSKRARAARTIAGIGVTANESRLDARGVLEQISAVRRAGLAGVALFDLDTTLEKNILPYLRAGVWRRPQNSLLPSRSGNRIISNVAEKNEIKYKRVLLKLSGEALGNKETGECIDPSRLAFMAGRVKKIRDMGVETGIVLGGGNIFRGLAGAGRGVDRVTGDTMGMLATVVNAFAMMNALEAAGVPARVMSAVEMPKIAELFVQRKAVRHLEKGRIVIFAGGTGNPYFSTDTAAALRAVEIGADALLKATNVDGIYTADPKKDPSAVKYDTLRYETAIEKRLKVMDSAAFALCMDNGVPIIVFDFFDGEALALAVEGGKVGTLVSDKG